MVVLVLGASFAFAQADLSATATWDPNCDPCPAGQRLTITATVTNAGPSPEMNAEVQLLTPAFGSSVVDDSWTTSQGSFDPDPNGNIVGMDTAGYYHYLWGLLGPMTPNSTATLTYQVDIVDEMPVSPMVFVYSPAELAGPFYPWGPPVMDSTTGDDWGFAADFWQYWGDHYGNAEWVNDGTALGNLGCGPLVGFTEGNIALVRRGECQFGLKAYNAQEAGATGVVVVNNTTWSNFGMAPGTDGPNVMIPTVIVPQEYADIFTNILTGGGTLTMSMPGSFAAREGDPWLLTADGLPTYWEFSEPNVWVFGNNDPDCCHYSAAEFATCCNPETSNNDVYLYINVGEGGAAEAPTAGFTWTADGLNVTFANTTTGTAPITYAWDFGDGGTSTDPNPTHAYAAAGTFTVTLTATNAEGSDTETQAVTVFAGAMAPTAGFTYTAAGLTATFTNTTVGTAPITYAWDFGDGATSTDLNPTHAYAVEGTYTVTLTATNAEGSDTATADVTVTADVPLDEFYFVAAAANAEGAAGSFFVTDLELNNPGTTTMSYRFLWLPRGADNSNPTASDVFTLAAGRSVRYLNVLNEVFAAEGVVGALAVVADSADAIIVSRTFNQTDNGTFGQSIDGLHSSQLIQANERVRVVFMSEDDASNEPAVGYRSNLGLLNGTGSPIAVMVARYNAAGEMLGDMQTVNLRPWENTQLNRILRSFAPVAGYVDVWTETADGAFAAYGSVLDNVTSDPTTVMPR